MMWQAPAVVAFLILATVSAVLLLIWLRQTLLKLETSRRETNYFALHDALTGAANRTLFDRRLNAAIEFKYLASTRILLIAIDVDNFKDVNDTFGHAAGDQLLKEVTRRLTFELPEEATLGRLGGDEFAIVQPGIISEGQAIWICERLLQGFEKPFRSGESKISITVSLGIAVEDGAVISAAEMLRRADLALYAAKADGRRRMVVYTSELDRARRERRALEVELRNALLGQTELSVQYQPIFDARTSQIAGAEALIRWEHPSRGWISPEKFIPIAEETGLIDDLARLVLHEACKVATANELPWVAVNLSPVQFQDAELASKLLVHLAKLGFSPSRLEIEITEGVLLQNSPVVQTTLAALRKEGVRIALDDFGTGYSSISYLRTYTVDKLKIDQSFSREVNEDQTTARLVRAMVEMAVALGMTVTAEGVETEAQRRILVEIGCTHLQGYLLSRPVTAKQLALLLQEQRSGGN